MLVKKVPQPSLEASTSTKYLLYHALVNVLTFDRINGARWGGTDISVPTVQVWTEIVCGEGHWQKRSQHARQRCQWKHWYWTELPWMSSGCYGAGGNLGLYFQTAKCLKFTLICGDNFWTNKIGSNLSKPTLFNWCRRPRYEPRNPWTGICPLALIGLPVS